MLASVAWLRSLCPFRESAAQIAALLTARGLTVDAVREERADAVLDVDVPANRPDCLGHLGLAREISAALGIPLLPRAAAPEGKGPPIESLVRVEIEDPDLCARYSARLVRGVRVAPSPAWVATRLSACGLHPINNVVDASNLVLLELGHPIHTFDLARVARGVVRVRRSRSGETLTTLDGVARALAPETLVIADAEHPIALAGIIGGAGSQITDATRDVLIEAAWFLPRSVRASARRLGLATDASHRFERGADPEAVAAAQELAVRLLAELAGGVPAPGIVDVRPSPAPPRTLRLRCARVERLLGFAPGERTIEDSLLALGLKVEPAGPEVLAVTPPSWRVDLEREADLVEEVGRHVGYDRIPSHLPGPSGEPPPPDPISCEEERAADLLADLGFLEAVCYSMLGAGEDDPFVAPGSSPPLALDNPISEPMARLRRSLLPGLLRALDLNLRRGVRDVRLFEIGRVFLPRDAGGFPDERVRVGLVWCGAARPAHWSAAARGVELHHVVGAVEALLGCIRPAGSWQRSAGEAPGLHPSRTALWRPAGSRAEPLLAWCGALHPALREALDLSAEPYLAEIDLREVRALAGGLPVFAPLPRVPAASRDLSLVLDRALPFETLRRLLAGAAAPAPVEIEVVDRYEGPPLAAGEVSLTVRVILQPAERTLSDEETEAYTAGLVRLLAEKGIRLRA